MSSLDADTIGAAIGMALAARQLGKAAEVVSVDHLAPTFDYLDESRRVHRRPELAPDLAVVCDAAALERVGSIVDDEAEWFREARILNIDHHVTNTNFGQVNLVDPSASPRVKSSSICSSRWASSQTQVSPAPS